MRFLPPLCLLLISCDNAALPAIETFSTRIEDGITHALSTSRAADSTSWRIDTMPALVIGNEDGDENYLIGRLAGYMRRPDGTILVGDQIAGTVRLYDADGTFMRTIGRAGDGPGEFRVLRNIMPHAADSLLIVDYEGRRVNVFTPDLEYVRSYRVRLDDGEPPTIMTSDALDASYGTARLLMSDFLNTCGEKRMNGFCQDSVALYQTDMTGKPVASLGSFVYGRTESVPVSRGFGSMWTEPHPQTFWRARGSKTVYADATRFELQFFDTAGTLTRIVHAPHDATRHSHDDVFGTGVKPEESLDPGIIAAQKARLDAVARAPVPDSLPQFSDVQIDELGYVWVREYVPAGRTRDALPRWLVFDDEGRLRYTLRAPRALSRSARPYDRTHPQIGPDFILAPLRNADGVESVAMYRLRRGTAATQF